MTIWKFPLETTDRQTIRMPKDACILSVQTQRGDPQLWAMVNSTAPMVGRRIRIYGTGHEMGEDLIPYMGSAFVGTYQLSGGALVFHVFDAGEIDA